MSLTQYFPLFLSLFLSLNTFTNFKLSSASSLPLIANSPSNQYVSSSSSGGAISSNNHISLMQQLQQQQQQQQLKLKPQNNRDAHLFIEHSIPASSVSKRVQVYPGLLDETLLNQGSFSFGAKTVKFDKLKVLGNIYVLKVNGKTLRDAYLLKSTLNKQENRAKSKVQKRGEGNEQIRLQILA